MKHLVQAINTLVLVLILLLYLLSNLSPYAPGEALLHSSEGTTVLYHIDHYRHLVSARVNEWRQSMAATYAMQLKVLAVGLFGLNILSWTISSLIPGRKQDKISLEVDGGTVSVTLRALEDSLARTLRAEAYVKDTKIVVRPLATRIDVKAFVTLIENPNLNSFEEMILKKMKNHLNTIFPIKKTVSYEVVVHKLRASQTPLLMSSAPATAVEDKKPEPSPVAQPRYPDNK